jgi:hypothetical protein
VGGVSHGLPIVASVESSPAYLDDAVVDGIQKRLDRVLDPRDLRRRLDALLPGDGDSEGAAATVTDRDGLVTELIASLANVREILDAGPSRPTARPSPGASSPGSGSIGPLDGGAALVSATTDCVGKVGGGGRN